jgi:hypothetical protein
VLFEGLPVERSDPEGALYQLKKMLWGHEALRIFSNTLSGALDEIQNARSTIEQALKEVFEFSKPLQL